MSEELELKAQGGVKIVCIKTKKVYEECRQLESDNGRAFEITVQGVTPPEGAVTCNCRIINPTVVSLEMCSAPPNLEPPIGLGGCPRDSETGLATGCCWQVPGLPGQGGIVEVCQPDIRLFLEVRFFDAGGTQIGSPRLGTGLLELSAAGKKAVRLNRVGEPRMQCEVDIFLDSVGCFIRENEVNEVVCCINVLKVIKLFAEVQLRVFTPKNEFCEQPPECEQPPLGECPEAEQTWPPFPPQFDDPPSGCKGC